MNLGKRAQASVCALGAEPLACGAAGRGAAEFVDLGRVFEVCLGFFWGGGLFGGGGGLRGLGGFGDLGSLGIGGWG